jgi:hypothetical protein
MFYVHPCSVVPEPDALCDNADGCTGFEVDGDGNCWCLGKAVATATIWQTQDGNLEVRGFFYPLPKAYTHNKKRKSDPKSKP